MSGYYTNFKPFSGSTAGIDIRIDNFDAQSEVLNFSKVMDALTEGSYASHISNSNVAINVSGGNSLVTLSYKYDNISHQHSILVTDEVLTMSDIIL